MTCADYSRISALRRRCLSRKHLVRQTTDLAAAESMKASSHLDSWQVRMGLRSRDELLAVRFAVDDLELLMGRRAPDGPDDRQLKDARNYLGKYAQPPGQTGHCQLDLSRAFDAGLDGVLAEVRERLADASGPAAEAYQSFIYAIEGFSGMIENAARTASVSPPPGSCSTRATAAPKA